MTKIVVPIPVYGRFPLVKQTIKRLYEKNKVHKVICIGHEPEAAKLCMDLGAEWVEHPNFPLGSKWNAGFKACEKHKPDAVLFAGSSDWIADDYLERASVYLSEYDLLGTLGCYFADVGNTIRVVYWEGYTSQTRIGEPIGIGRLLSNKLLKHMRWKPFNDKLDNSLDWSMWSVAKNFKVKILDSSYITISISHKNWPNKHNFKDHWTGSLKDSSKKLDYKACINTLKGFPEIHQLG